MTISEMIKQLEELKEKHGDLPVAAFDQRRFLTPILNVEYLPIIGLGEIDAEYITLRIET